MSRNISLLCTLLLLSAALDETVAQTKTSLRGRVIGIDGKPATGLVVSLYTYNNTRAGALDSAVTDSDGGFTLETAGPGTVALRIVDEDRLPRMIEPIAIPAAMDLDMQVCLKQLKPGPPLDMFEVSFSDSTVSGLYAAAWGMRERELHLIEAVLQHQMAGEPDTTFFYDVAPAFADVERRITSASTPLLREAWVLNYIALIDLSDTAEYNSERMRLALTTIPASSQLWSLFPRIPISAAEKSGGIARHREFLEAITRENPNMGARAKVLFALLAMAHKEHDTARVHAYVRRFREEFPNTFEAEKAQADYDPDRNIVVGKKVPTFSVSSLDDSTKTISNETLLGKYYLIDFWATWCVPCIAELGNLHKVYAMFRDRNFEIVSLSFDPSPERVERLRSRQETPMPWQHGWVEGGYKNPIATAFGITGIPRPLLIGPDGRILVEVESKLRGDDLMKTLSQYLPAPGEQQ